MIGSLLFFAILAGETGYGGATPAAATAVDPVNSALRELYKLRAERTRLRVHHRKGHPRFAQIKRRVAAIHKQALRKFETVGTDAVLACSEEARIGQASYGVILSAVSIDDIAANELLLFHGGRVYRTSGSFRKLPANAGAGWYFRPNVDIPENTRFVVACIQDAPEELRNVKKGFMPNSNRARDPKRPYRTKVFNRHGKPLSAVK